MKDTTNASGVLEWNLSDMFGARVTPQDLADRLNSINWNDYQDATIRLRGCLPVWGFIMVASRLVGIARCIEWTGFDGTTITVWQESGQRGQYDSGTAKENAPGMLSTSK
ncbi:MAG: hypothetical protein V2G42_04225 [bacterium JZ-2024 1]